MDKRLNSADRQRIIYLANFFRIREPADLLEADDLSDEWAGKPGGVAAEIVAVAWFYFDLERKNRRADQQERPPGST